MHDRVGRKLNVGDSVVILATVTNLQPTGDFCNVSVETVYGRRPDDRKECISAINTNVMLKVNPDEA